MPRWNLRALDAFWLRLEQQYRQLTGDVRELREGFQASAPQRQAISHNRARLKPT
jgi:TolA-binding protein